MKPLAKALFGFAEWRALSAVKVAKGLGEFINLSARRLNGLTKSLKAVNGPAKCFLLRCAHWSLPFLRSGLSLFLRGAWPAFLHSSVVPRNKFKHTSDRQAIKLI